MVLKEVETTERLVHEGPSMIRAERAYRIYVIVKGCSYLYQLHQAALKQHSVALYGVSSSEVTCTRNELESRSGTLESCKLRHKRGANCCSLAASRPRTVRLRWQAPHTNERARAFRKRSSPRSLRPDSVAATRPAKTTEKAGELRTAAHAESDRPRHTSTAATLKTEADQKGSARSRGCDRRWRVPTPRQETPRSMGGARAIARQTQ
eukprot:3617185-Pleurochrysis_carterae.AAC.2